MTNPVPTFYPGFSTAALSELFSPAARVAGLASVEAALAAASADARLISHEVAMEIGRACAVPVADPGALLDAGWEVGSPLLPLLDELRAALSPEAAAALHYGATTQDVVDSAAMVQIRDAIGLVAADLAQAGAALAALAARHRATPMTGRTFLRPARPTTFGARAALWLDPLITLYGELAATAAALPVQLGGPVGNEMPLGAAAPLVAAGVAQRLGLAVPRVPWPTDRAVVAAAMALMVRTAAAAGKIASDLAHLGQAEVGELRTRAGSSSAMPGKENPIDSIRALAAARACAAVAQAVTAAPPHELERGVGSWHVEWFAVPLVCQTAGAAVEAVRRAVESIEVDAARMQANLGEEIDPMVVAAAEALIERVLAAAADTFESG